MKNYLATFTDWTKLNESTDYSISQKIEDLKTLADLGIITPDELKKEFRKYRADEIKLTIPEVKEIIDTPEYREFQKLGLELVSSRTQLFNGTLVFGQPGYQPKDQFAIGLFQNGTIKRLTPKGIKRGVWGRELGEMDMPIKQFKLDSDFYRTAMRWCLDHIDFEALDSRTGTPFYPVKTRTRKSWSPNF